MNRDRFNLETIIYLVVGLVFFAIFITCYQAAFPSASIKLEVTRSQAVEVASEFLQARGYDLSGYTEAKIFGVNSYGAVFLQQTQGMEKANEMMDGEVPIWRWQCRWFKSGEKEEFRVFVDPAGQVISFRHAIEEDKAGAEIPQEAAEALAKDFLTGVAGLDLSLYERVEASTKKLSNRADHNFEWKLKDFEVTWKEDDPEAGTGTLRAGVDVQGDRVGGFGRYFKTPELFDREYSKTSAKGQLLGIISLVLMFLTAVAALVVFILRYKRDDIRWRFAMVAGLAILVGYLLLSLNSFPLIKFGYRTDMGYGVFIGIMVAAAFVGAIIYCAFILFTGASGDSLTREVYPGSLGAMQQLMQGRVFTRSFFFASIRGYALGFFFLGYITLFYLVGRKYLGVFMPAEGPYSNLLGTYLPWLFPLTVSLLAAISEEFVSRFFSISFLKRYLKLTWLALLIPAAIWAFGHSTYPVFPVYVRGIELTIAGVIFGIFFIRFNLMTCIVAHYAIDAIFIALPLLRSGNNYYIVSGLIVCALAAVPLLLGLPGLREKAGDDGAAG
ncbi:MAG: CPBP family intramembrane metalloprotease [Candidatus Glassbacteria bacterium]|nr:CPBP family intramembrane metalloprotease [Candidatus Glassbacteria bacterium]